MVAGNRHEVCQVRRLGVPAAAVLLILAATSGPAPFSSTVHPTSAVVTAARPPSAPIAEQDLSDAMAATVEITTEIGKQMGGMAGSGAVVDVEKGLVVTNAHVVFGVRVATVRTATGAEVEATVIAKAPCDDLAVLQLDSVPKGLRSFVVDGTITLAEGDPVTALGYPVLDDGDRPDEATVTSGAVLPTLDSTATASIATSGPPLASLVEHSARLIPGNSGGPLLDRDGWLVGINTLSGAKALAGTGFSVPTARLAQLLPELRAGRSVLDVGWALAGSDDELYGELVGDEERAADTPTVRDTPGLWVAAVDPGTPAAGRLVPGDYITAVAGEPVADDLQVCSALRAHAGETVRVDGRYLSSATGYGANRGDAFFVELPVPAAPARVDGVAGVRLNTFKRDSGSP